MLEKILEEKRKEVQLLLDEEDSLLKEVSLLKEKKVKNSFTQALLGKSSPRIIAEVKKASPSKGIIEKDFDPLKIAKSYESNGAACISVLTDEKFFQGKLSYLKLIKKEVSIPLLRKDFIIHSLQVYQSYVSGADAILLIAAALNEKELEELLLLALELKMDVLTEIHNQTEMDKVLSLFSKLNKHQLEKLLLGVNNRDLKTFETNTSVTKNILKENDSKIKELSVPVVSESGIYSRKDILELEESGASAFLIGEALMKDKNLLGNLVSNLVSNLEKN